MSRRVSFHEKLSQMMAKTGRSYSECCKFFGSHGGRTSAARRRRRLQESRRIRFENIKQEAIGIR